MQAIKLRPCMHAWSMNKRTHRELHATDDAIIHRRMQKTYNCTREAHAYTYRLTFSSPVCTKYIYSLGIAIMLSTHACIEMATYMQVGLGKTPIKLANGY